MIKFSKKPTAPLISFTFLIIFLILNVSTALAADDFDSDGDKLKDDEEINIFKTNPYSADTDGDGFLDYEEIYYGYSPTKHQAVKLSQNDSDNDGTPDSWEIKLGLDLLNPDTDNDGYTDGSEIINGYNPASSSTDKIIKKIIVSLEQQRLTYYYGNTELESFLISSGIKSMPTPRGKFNVLDKVPSKTYGGVGYNFFYPNTKWNLHFTTQKLQFYIHGTYWHNNFGRPMSHGCINVAYPQMERLYNFAEIGTEIEIK